MECGGMVFACQQIFNVPVIRGRDTLVDLNIAILVGGYGYAVLVEDAMTRL